MKLPKVYEYVKSKMEIYTDNRHGTKSSCLTVGDFVLVRQQNRNKLASNFDPSPYRITGKNGTMVTATRADHTITRNVQHFKFLSKEQPQQYMIQKEPDFDFYYEPPIEPQPHMPDADNRMSKDNRISKQNKTTS